ncbi:MAG: PAS domain S-box protein [Alphaproteobacteria bacterium]|nr:PAS domain S-box protein [Alphaproteobacteria bacterium]
MTEANERDSLPSRLGRILGASASEIMTFHAETLTLLAISRGARDNLGLDDQEWRGLTPIDLMPEFNRGRFERLLFPLRTGDSRDVAFQTMQRRKDGSHYPVEVRLQFSGEAAPALFVATIHDITAVQEREGELLRVSRAMMALTRSSEALVHASSERQLIDQVCRIAVEQAGYRMAWVGYARPDRSVEPVAVSGDDHGYVAAARVSWDEADPRGGGPMGRAIRTGRMVVSRDTASDASFAPWRDEAKRHGFASLIALPMTIRGGVIGALAIYGAESDSFDEREVRLLADLARNLAYGVDTQRTREQRLRAERELTESEERYRTLVELSPDAILVHVEGSVVFANAAARSVFRADEHGSLEGRSMIELVPPQHRERLARRLPLHHLAEFVLMRLDGETFHAEVAVGDTTFLGQPARQLVIRDISERKQIEAQLIQAGKLAVLGEMAAGMAHELSQPLNIMRMAAEGALLLIERGRATPVYQTGQFALISDQARRMAEIIDHIRAFSRKDSDAIAVFDACDAARQAAALMAQQVRHADVDLVIDLPPAPLPVKGRPVQLEQVMINLLANALDSVRERLAARGGGRGRIEIRARPAAAGLMRLTVGDNGTGVAPSLLDRIFEPFFTTKEGGRGTGLGLSVSFGIVNRMGGSIEARNRDCLGDGGALFDLLLPFSDEPLAETAPAAPLLAGPTPPPDLHILVVDDEPRAVEMVALFLADMGYRVSTAQDGVAAWEAYMADPADAVVTDMRMPKGGGFELIDRLRDFDPLLPIVVVTGHMGGVEALGEHADDRLVLLNKPVSLKRLAETLEALVRPPDE